MFFMKDYIYIPIKTKTQYYEYSNKLEKLITSGKKGKQVQQEIDILSAFIELWDLKHNTFSDSDPIELLRSLMEQKKIKQKELAEVLGVSKGLISDILNYKKSLSKEIIRGLSHYFKLSQEAFNREYSLKKEMVQA
jgi:HTH-type transcriptional regulator / antitoxin HigA